MNKTKKVLITVKTYPTISKKYDELVCTAGVQEDGSWIRIYPMPFRKLDYENQYKKYQWMEAPFIKNQSDPRPESYSVTDIHKIKLLNTVDTSHNWSERKKIIFNNQPIFTNLKKLISKANSNELSLAIFKPQKIVNFIWENTDREWSKEKRDLLKAKSKQMSFFQSAEEIEKEFSVVPKLPYRFSYEFIDDEGTKSVLMIEDWEIGMLYWNCLMQCSNNEKVALQRVEEKYFDKFLEKDLYLFLGTLKQYHGWAKNPFVIVGIFYPPFNQQQDLF
ncbi:MAG: hypothetical protein WAU61_02040 [Smithella sp.]